MKSKIATLQSTLNVWLKIVLLVFISVLSLSDAFTQCKGGKVFVNDRRENVSLCPAAAAEVGLDIFTDSNASAKYAFAVTDINNSILYVSTSSKLKFENLIEGTYFVFGFSYEGDILAKSGDYVYNTKFASGCWQISFSRVTVKLAAPRASEIRTGDFQTKKNLCLNEGGAAVVNFRNISPINTDYIYLITDTNNRIVEVNTKGFSDFSNAIVGDRLVYGLAYTGRLTASPGMKINDLLATGCFTLSDNALEINVSRVDGGNIFTDEFMSFYRFTTDDTSANMLQFSNSGSSDADFAYVLTDAQNRVIQFLAEPTFDFEGLAVGVYRVWGFSYSGEILLSEGHSIFGAPFSDGCYRLSFNAITVTAVHEGITTPPCNIVATVINTSDDLVICENDNIQSINIDTEMGVIEETHLILVDNNNNIVNISQIPTIDINGIPPSVYTIVQIVYVEVNGLTVGSALDDLSGCFELSNRIRLEILNQENDNCTVPEECTLTASLLSVNRDTICIEDTNNLTVVFAVENEDNAQQGIIVTDVSGQILQLSADRIFQINTVGTQLFYHINYVDTVQIFGGEPISELVGCFALSEPILITGIENCFTPPCAVEAAQISTNSPTALCTDDITDNEVTVNSVGGSSDASLFLLIEVGSPSIIESNTTGKFQFLDNNPGDFEIYELAYNEPFTLADDIFALEGCFTLSESIAITNNQTNCIPVVGDCMNQGGEIAYSGPTGICGSDGQNDLLAIDMIVNGGSNKVFLVVNEAGLIVNVAPALVILNNPFPEGVYEIYAMSYEDFPAGVMVNANFNELENLCLSNSISIIVSDDFCEGAGVRGGQVTDDFGQTEVKFCTNLIEEVFTIDLINTGSEAFSYTYIETDENNIITNIFDGASVMYISDPTKSMNKRIWGVSYTGNFIAFVGEEISSVLLSDESFSVSDNFIEIEISVVIAEDPVILGFDIPFLEVSANETYDISLMPNMSSFLDYNTAYILFDTNGVTIIDILYPDDDFNITLPALTETPVSGALLQLSTIAYTGNILLEVGGEANSSFLPNATNVTDGCFEVAGVNISIQVVSGSGGIVFPLLNELRRSSGEEIELRPNPAKEIVQVYLPSSFVDQKLVIHIMDAAGRLVFKKNFDKAPTTESIDVSHLSNGVYIIQAYTNNSARTAKLLKI